jgi:hypothetical protein
MKPHLAFFLALALSSSATAQLATLGGGKAVIAAGPPGMTTPIISDGSANGTGSLTNSAPAYIPVASGYSSPYSATYGAAANVIPLAGTISNLSVRMPAAVSSGSWQVGLYQNGALSALQCTLSGGLQTCSYSGSITVNAGDKIEWQLTPSGSPTVQSPAISALFTANSGVNQGPILMSSNGTVPTGSTYYMGPGMAPVVAASTLDITVSGVVPVAGTITSIWGVSNGLILGGTYTFTAWHNGSATLPAMTCQVTPSVSSCSSSTNPFTVAAGDTISCAGAPSGVTTARAMSCGFVWQPTAPGQALVWGNGRAVVPVANATNTDYYGVASVSAPGSHLSETVTQQLSPTLPGGHTLTLGNLYVAQSGTPAINGSGRATTLRAGSASVGPHCTIGLSSGTIGGTTAY